MDKNTKFAMILVVFSLVWLNSCVTAGNSIDKSRQYIMDDKIQVYVSEESFDGRWVPESARTDEALAAAYGYLQSELKESGSDGEYLEAIWDHFGDYSVQFYGIIRNGEKIIFCNFFLTRWEGAADPSKYPVVVFGGGNAFWNIEYRISDKACQYLWINAPI